MNRRSAISLQFIKFRARGNNRVFVKMITLLILSSNHIQNNVSVLQEERKTIIHLLVSICLVIDKIWALMDMTFTQADPIKVQKQSTRK